MPVQLFIFNGTREESAQTIAIFNYITVNNLVTLSFSIISLHTHF